MMTATDTLLQKWKEDPYILGNICAWKKFPAKEPDFAPFPSELHPDILATLEILGINQLYSHQREAWELTQLGENITIATGTASGKTLCYNLPVFDSLLKNKHTKALYIFPTKALTQDQLHTVKNLSSHVQSFENGTPAILPDSYDGDTRKNSRPEIRKKSRLVLTNPDMLHAGILPYHTLWASFFQGLKYVVIDEIHIYRGVFGSHVANVIRRLKRIAHHYHCHLQFVLTSATIGNPTELSENLIEEPVTLINQDGSGSGERHFLFYNPPFEDQELGIRVPLFSEIEHLSRDFLSHGIQTIIFGRSRKAVESILINLRSKYYSNEKVDLINQKTIRAYRSGYLPKHRREIETDLRNGTIQTVIATTALELGIDIGRMGAALLAGYPGTISGTWQQVGRAGRRQGTSLAVLMVSNVLIDQFLARSPEYFFDQTPEKALIDPNNLLILLDHLKCAIFELPFLKGDGFGNVDAGEVLQFLEFLVSQKEAHLSENKYYWMSEAHPTKAITLRNISHSRYLLKDIVSKDVQIFGEVDGQSVFWLVHPHAIYLHEGDNYVVTDLDIDQKVVFLKPVDVDYYTKPIQETEITILKTIHSRLALGGKQAYGEISVKSQVVGYRKVKNGSQENLGTFELSLPQSELNTSAYWLMFSEETVNQLRSEGLWTNAPNNYGPAWHKQRDLARKRDGYVCSLCGLKETHRKHHVHHKIPFRKFSSQLEANDLTNLITLCPSCHKRVESGSRIRSGLSGLAYLLGNLAPLFLMCDYGDLGVFMDPTSQYNLENPLLVIFDQIPGGIGFSKSIYERHDELFTAAIELAARCGCKDGCPSCVGPGGELGMGSKFETIALLEILTGN